MLRFFLPLALVALVSTSACRRKTEAPPVAPSDPSVGATTDKAAPSASVPAVQPPPPTQSPGLEKVEDRLPTAPPDSSKTNPVDQKLTEALHHYLEANGKLPPDFNALVTAKILKQMPTAPAGKRYAVDRRNLQVVLLSQ